MVTDTQITRGVETARLESLEEQLQACLPESFRECSADLLRKVRRNGVDDRWSASFAPLTIFYPRLQAESFPGVPAEVVDAASVAHALILIGVFSFDRWADGQLTPHHDEKAFLEAVGGAAVDRCVRLAGNDPAAEPWVGLVREAFRLGAVRAEHEEPAKVHAEHPSRAYTVSYLRARAGFAATALLACRSGLPRWTIRKLNRAYGCLVTGLQWYDDTEDWAEDLQTGDHNLLFDRLRLMGFDAYTCAGTPTSQRDTAYALVRAKLVPFGLSQALRWLRAAKFRQWSMGNRAIIEHMNDTEMRIAGALHRITDHAAEVAFALAPESSGTRSAEMRDTVLRVPIRTHH